jgi:hypothetical protein
LDDRVIKFQADNHLDVAIVARRCPSATAVDFRSQPIDALDD